MHGEKLKVVHPARYFGVMTIGANRTCKGKCQGQGARDQVAQISLVLGRY